MAELLVEANRRVRQEVLGLIPRRKTQEIYCTCCDGVHHGDYPESQEWITRARRPGVNTTEYQWLRPPPVTRQALLGIQLIQHISHLHPHSAWIELLPMRLGHDAHTDLAALALAESLDYHFGGRIEEPQFNAAMICYDKAVSHLRTAIESRNEDGFEDATLITVALLAICEVMISNHSTVRQRNVFIHWSGLKSVFLAKYQPSQVSDVGRAIMYNLWDCSFGVACATGTPSPFEDGTWMQLEPAALHGTSAHALVLRKITNQLCIRTPRFIACVRALRGNHGLANRGVLNETALIAKELYDYKDEASESALLHRVKVAKTKDESSRAVVPYSYAFLDINDFSAAAHNWAMRQVILNLCLTAHRLLPATLCPFDTATVKDMEAENQRLATNVMMSWEFAETLGPFATLWVAKGLLQNWLHLRNNKTFKNVSSAAIRNWALPKMNHQFNEWLAEDVRESDMDVAADLLVGGPLIGFIAQTGAQTT